MKAVIVLNAGSSSLKFALFALPKDAAPYAVFQGLVEGIGLNPHCVIKNQAQELEVDQLLSGEKGAVANHHQVIEFVIDWIESHDIGYDLIGVGHRVVHGGDRFSEPVQIDDEVLAYLHTLTPLAPLHQPHNLEPVEVLKQLRPHLPQIACFDTAFHRSQPEVATRFGLPRRYHDAGVKRYGFHGLSYAYIATQLPDALKKGKVVVAHLGNGSSMCALSEGQSIGSSMGFTALDGLMMGTRCGTVDPGALLYMMEQEGLDAKAITRCLYKESGLLGVSGGISSDMRTLLASDAIEAQEAIELFCYRINRELGGLTAALGGIDALVFTAGIGEHSAAIRSKVCALAASWTGLVLDETANEKTDSGLISAPNSRIQVWVIPTNEERMIARHVVEVLAG